VRHALGPIAEDLEAKVAVKEDDPVTAAAEVVTNFTFRLLAVASPPFVKKRSDLFPFVKR
jgi:hypothetical protein